MRFALASFASVAAATLALAQPHPRAELRINPPRNTVQGVTDWGNLPPAAHKPNTNAKRFAMKLPPLSPRTHHPQRAAPHRLGSRVQAAPRAQTSPLPPVNQKCFILVKSATQTFGYLSSTFNDYGEYGLVLSDPSGLALQVAFSYSPDSPSQLDLTAVNGQAPSFPFLGGVIGFASTSDNFGIGSYNYAYVAGTGQTPPGSRPVFQDSTFGTATGVPTDSESAIWVYNPTTQAITAQWINTDGSAPATSFVYANDFNKALLMTGDANKLRSTFGASYPDVTLTCVPVAVAPSRH